MAPFWRSSSNSPDNEKNDEEEEEEEPKLPSEDASTISSSAGSSATVPVDEQEVAMAAAATDSEVSSDSQGNNQNNETNKQSSRRQEGLLDLLNDIGQSFKPKAETAVAKGYQSDGQGLKVFYAIKACLYYMLFILYRTYRGLFILVPAVFRNVYKKMELAMNANDLTLADEESDDDAVAAPEKPVTWRTKITVSILATVVTASYVVGATFQMCKQFLRTITKSKSVPKSFEAAADELVTYEDKVSKIGKINGDPNMEPGGFAP